MAIQYNILQRGFRNVVRDGQAVGFQLLVKSSYYRGVALSLIDSVDVAVDGETFGNDVIRLGIGGRTYSFAEMATLSDVQWPWLEPATVVVARPGGLKAAVHDVQVTVRLRISYMPITPVVYSFRDKVVLMG
ncbi:MAG: hypothetical protein IT480_14920 [Gammaproteobacteria bacterium]|nr:hypothetical protein [Gammaproteobacteria bacterium]